MREARHIMAFRKLAPSASDYTVASYRAGASDHHGFERLQSELAAFSSPAFDTIKSDDLNIHPRRWLFHANENTAIEAEMKVLCVSFGLQQLLREAASDEYILLDLFPR